MRAFLAVGCEDEELLNRVEDVQGEFLRTRADLKMVSRENLHITLKFLGEIDERTKDEVVRRLRGIRFKPFTLNFRGMGAFPDLRRVNVVWIGVEEGPSRPLTSLHRSIEEALAGLPFAREELSPHLTIFRVRSGLNIDAVKALLQKHREAFFGSQLVSVLKLKKSVLTQKGPIYSDIYRFPSEG